jgi:exonuclease III
MFFSHYLETHNFDIVGISETKLKESATNFAFKEQAIYKCFWSSNDLEPRGTGVGLLIKKDIAKHIQKVFRFNGRLLSVTLLFKGMSHILIIQVYLPSDKKSSRIYQTQIRKLIAEETKKNTNIIIMGDFNAVVLPHLDRSSRGKDKFSTSSHKPEIPLFDFFEDWAFTDLQVTWQGGKHTFTWKNSLSESRIDQT